VPILANMALRRPSISKDDAEKAIQFIVADKPCQYQLVEFKNYKNSHQGRVLTSQHYRKYYVLCYANTMYHAGWLVCPYVMNGFCGKDGIMELNTSKGGTTRLSRHLHKHEQPVETGQVQDKELSDACRRNITDGAALAVILDLRPLGFAENNPGIAAFATEVFKAGQTCPTGFTINPKSYLPSRQAVTDAISRTAKQLRTQFAKQLHDNVKGLGGAVTVDGVTLKMQGRHYYDYTLHHIEIKHMRGTHLKPTYGIKTNTILFVEGPGKANAVNIKEMLDKNLQRDYGINFDTMHKTFTLVTDGAAVMAKMAGSSVSESIAIPDEKWMRCYVHVLHNTMKAVMEECTGDDTLDKIGEDFKAMKKIVENSKKAGWNCNLPVGYHLIQEVETRFGTHYVVAERFLKSREKVWDLIVSQKNASGRKLYKSLLQQEGELPTIQAIVDVFRPVYDATILFQAAHQPTLHNVLPNLQYCLEELGKLQRGELIQRENDNVVSPSVYAMRLSGMMAAELKRIKVHDLWLVACFLYPLMRDFSFWSDPAQREEFKLRGETLTRVLFEEEMLACTTANPAGSASGTPLNPTTGTVTTGRVQKNPKYTLKKYVRSVAAAPIEQNEINRYKATLLPSLGFNEDPDDPFAAVKFWYGKKSKYPILFKIATRVYATPASSSTSERVFSTLKNIVTSQRTRISADHLSELIVARSLHLYRNS